MSFGVITVVRVKIAVLWVVTSFSLVDGYRVFK